MWDRSLLLRAGTLVVDRRHRPYKRLSATIIVCGRGRFVLQTGDARAREYEGVLIAPNVARRYIEAVDVDLAILDAGIASGAYRALEPRLVRGDTCAIGTDEVQRIRAALEREPVAEMGCEEAMRVFATVVAILAPAAGGALELDARVRRVMELVEERPFDATSLSLLAREVGLSESRLRDLFRKTLGCPLSQYARWVAAWKAIHLWKKGMTFTDVAHAVGFHDLAHADHALGETFGMSPSEMARIDLQRCGG